METNSFEKKFVIALDIGTTNLKCHLYSKDMNLISKRNIPIHLLCMGDGTVEIQPNVLWDSVVFIVNQVLIDANITANQVLCLGISSQRGTFITWDSVTKRPFHNFITWKDTRANFDIMKWNKSIFFKILKFCCYCLYLVSGSSRFLTASLLKFTTSQVTVRLFWILKTNKKLKNAVKNGTAMFGTLDTWLLYRLTNGKSYLSDVSSVSGTGMYDPFTMSWISMKLFGIPNSILPNMCDSAGTHFGSVSSDIWGSEILITCCIADQSAALYGSCCFSRGDIKITLGTGAFFNINVGSVIEASKTGFYPLIGWNYEGNRAYVLESSFDDCGTVIDWAHSVGFFKNMQDLSKIMKSFKDTEDIYFIPAFSNSYMGKTQIGSGFIGIKSTTKKTHLIRAIVRSIVFRIYDLYLTHVTDISFKKLGTPSLLRVNGGVSNNDFICQSVADICYIKVVRPACVDVTVRGAALLAGHAVGLRTDSINENIGENFYPNEIRKNTLRSMYTEWAKVRSRFLK